METRYKFDLEDRLIQFAVCCIQTAEKLPRTFAGNHLGGQLTRSGSAPALHYGEAQSAESRTDFIHKMKVALKELRETRNCLAIIEKLNWEIPINLSTIRQECTELVFIFLKSIDTAKKNNTRKPLPS
ncbi:four helix bundle protein [Sediminibacterium sp.]|uniref:four helix bundle protein n=1 Tax=Sediminibacterium sp. TaxID=1917865 RepID=UPI0025D3B9A2|nr:four helix bundle protein [Sediminibacterium sp.]MBW0176823.1 four helix bundle protein [Sediminibacterium sp.]